MVVDLAAADQNERGGGVGVEQREGADDDAELAARATSDRDAFGTLYDRYVLAIYRYCYRRTGNREQAEDATSAIFTRAMEALPGFRGGSFPAWLFAIAHSVLSNQVRRRPIEGTADVEGEPDLDLSPEERALHADERRALIHALDELLPEQRRVVELRLAGLTGAEIAEALGKSVAAVKMLQLRAFRHLRRTLDEPESETTGHHESR